MAKYFAISDSLLACCLFFLLKVSTVTYGQGVPGTNRTRTTTVSPVTTTTSNSIVPEKQITWQVSSTNGSCVLLTGNFSFSISYKIMNGYTSYGRITIPSNATVFGKCGPFVQTLGLSWASPGGSSVNNITFLFIKKVTYVNGMPSGDGEFFLATIFGMIIATDPIEFANSAVPNQSYYISAKEFPEFNTPLTKSYVCQSYKSYAVDKTGNVYLEMQQVQAEAFHEGPDDIFRDGSVCSKDIYYMVLPILAYAFIGLIITAVLASFVWRSYKRSGYGRV